MDKLRPFQVPKVVHLQYGTSPSGNYTLRQHEAFLKAGFRSTLLSLYSSVTGDPRIKSLTKVAQLKSRVNQKLQDIATKNRNKEYGAFSCSFIGSDVSNHPFIKEADYIYVHYVLGGFLSIRNLGQLAKLGKPLIIVMHDMWSITGGCSYSFECRKFNSHCGNCPILAGQKEEDLSYLQFKKKKSFYEKFDNLYFISPSNWLSDLAKKAELTKNKPIFRIPNPIDRSLFKPFDKGTAKGILNIAPEQYVIAFGANKITSPYKGWKYLQAALQTLKQRNLDKNIIVLVFGAVADQAFKDAIPFETRFMGFISDDYTTNLIYNAADVFVAPSLADNLPTTIIESMCCGTPVVGFNNGGIPDMIKHKKNGYLAQYKNEEDLAEGIEYCLNHRLIGNLSDEFSTERIIEDHLNLYSYISKRQKNSAG